MRSRVFLVGIAAVLLSLSALIVPVTAQKDSEWHWMYYAPQKLFTHFWNGTFLGTLDGMEVWELYSELMTMMPTPPGGMTMGDGVEWVKMTIKWDPVALRGDITRFEHHGYNLRFTGLTGSIWFNPVYHFQVSGRGVGLYRANETWYSLVIWANYEGVGYPEIEDTPFVRMRTEATEQATLKYGVGSTVGGEVAPVNTLALLAPWIVIAVSAFAIGFPLSRRKLYLH